MAALETIPSEREVLIVVGSSARKPLSVLQPFLQSLLWQELPPKVKLIPVFVPDWPDPNDIAAKYLKDFVAQHEGHLIRGVAQQDGDFNDTGVPSHQWSLSAMRRVGQNKNRILKKAAELRADYVWFADADLILDRTTLWSLYHAQTPAPNGASITSGVYWTRWQKGFGETGPAPAGPQVWLRHPYELAGRGLEEAEFRDALARRALTQVWGQGACTLLSRAVWEAGVNFDTLPDVRQDGLMAGEDRQFCIAAERKHLPMFADPWPDIFHLYHLPDDLEHVPDMMARLGTPHPATPAFGDLVSLILHAVEPIRQPNQTLVNVQPTAVRGRLGSLDLMPELEQAILSMRRGETRIVPAHCPVHHPIAYYRGKRRLFKVTLVDCKPFGYAPVLEDDVTPAGLAHGLSPAEREVVRGV